MNYRNKLQSLTRRNSTITYSDDWLFGKDSSSEDELASSPHARSMRGFDNSQEVIQIVY